MKFGLLSVATRSTTTMWGAFEPIPVLAASQGVEKK